MSKGKTISLFPDPKPADHVAPRKQPPLVLGVVLGAVMAIGAYLDLQASATIVSLHAQAGGPLVTVAARAAGLLAEVSIDEGQRVAAGQVIARLDDADVRAAILEGEANLAAAQAELAGSRTWVVLQGARTALDLGQAEADSASARASLRAAEAAVSQARTQHARLLGLVKKGIVSTQEVEDASLAVVSALAAMDTARARIGSADAGMRHARSAGAQESIKRDDVAVLTAKLRGAEARLGLARLRREVLVIKAPVAGVVARRMAHPGETMATGQVIATLVDPARSWVTAYVTEAQAPRIREGAAASLRFEALPGHRFSGHVAFVAATTGNGNISGQIEAFPMPAGLRMPQEVPVRLLLDSPEPALRPGMSAWARIEASN